MQDVLLFSERLQKALQPAPSGAIGMVDELLELCYEWRLRLDWRDNRCQIHAERGDVRKSMEVPMRKSVMRALIARFNTLCEDCRPLNKTPDKSEGMLLSGTMILLAEFVNTDDVQWIILRRK